MIPASTKILWTLAFLTGFSLIGCARKEDQGSNPESIFTLKDGKIDIDTRSPMMKYLEIGKVEDSHNGTQDLRVVGQIFALANHSDQLVGSKISWVELDPELTKSLGFECDNNTQAKVGEAFGVVDLPEEYFRQLKANESVSILRYGLLESRSKAKVIRIQRAPEGQSQVASAPIEVLFKISEGQDWYPGTNCVVSFPMLGAKPYLIPATALLHEGRQEYLLQEMGKGDYLPKPVYVLDTLPDSVLVIGDIKAGDAIVARGSILLKPILHRLLRAQNAKSAAHQENRS